MDSKAAKALDKALLKVEQEYEKFKRMAADVRKEILKHYPPKNAKVPKPPIVTPPPNQKV